MAVLRSTTDGVVVIQPSEKAQPIGRVVVDGRDVGWVHYDVGDAQTDVEIRHGVSTIDRADEYAARAVTLLVHHLALVGTHRTATLRADRHDAPSLAVAVRAGFRKIGDRYQRAIPPLAYSDGVVTIRRQRPEDLEADVTAKDDEQIDWLWQPGDRQLWEAMTRSQQRARAARTIAAHHDGFGAGPKWSFSVDGPDADYVAYIDCDLANERVPAGEANISYASRPAHRGRGYVTRAVRLITRFIIEHTGARRAYLVVDAQNVASMRVARAVGSEEVERWTNDRNRMMVRHQLRL